MSTEPRAHTPEPRVLIVCGSPRTNGNSDLLARSISETLEAASVPTDTVRLPDLDFSPCAGCELCREGAVCPRFTDDMTPLYERIEDARGLVLISPVHNYNVTAWMKAFIDRLYCFYEFEYPRPGAWSSRLADQNRKAVVLATAEQVDPNDAGFTLEAMARPLEALGYEIVEEVLALRVFEKGAVAERPDLLEATEHAADALVRALTS